jgi:hypothetical protein
VATGQPRRPAQHAVHRAVAGHCPGGSGGALGSGASGRARQNAAWTDESGEDVTALPPVSAKSAYGLDPLDAATAGLARANRLRLIQLGVLALGAIALISGIVLIISGMSH